MTELCTLPEILLPIQKRNSAMIFWFPENEPIMNLRTRKTEALSAEQKVVVIF